MLKDKLNNDFAAKAKKAKYCCEQDIKFSSLKKKKKAFSFNT